MIVYVSRRERFSSAHKLCNPTLTEEENNQIYDKCAYPNYHGHNYELFVTVKGEINPKTGYTMDMKILSKLMKERVVNKLDHKNLNLDVDFLKDKITTTENILVSIWNELDGPVQSLGCSLHKIKLVETENNYAEYYGN